MAEDPYSKYLGMAPGKRPPRSYELLGIPANTRDAAVIEAAAADRMDQLDRYALASDRATREQVQQLMNEVAKARTRLVARLPKEKPVPKAEPKADSPADPQAATDPHPDIDTLPLPSVDAYFASTPDATPATPLAPSVIKPAIIFWSLIVFFWVGTLAAVYAVTFVVAKIEPTDPTVISADTDLDEPLAERDIERQPDPPGPVVDPQDPPADPVAEPEPTGPTAAELAAQQAEQERLALQESLAEKARQEQAMRLAAEAKAEQQRLAEQQARDQQARLAEQERQRQEMLRKQETDRAIADIQAQQERLSEELGAARLRLVEARDRLREKQHQGAHDRADAERYREAVDRYRAAGERYRAESERLSKELSVLRGRANGNPAPEDADRAAAEEALADREQNKWWDEQYIQSRDKLKGRAKLDFITKELSSRNGGVQLSVQSEHEDGELVGLDLSIDYQAARAKQGNALLTDLTALAGLNLRKLNLERCVGLTSLKGLEGMPLQWLNLKHCTQLADITAIKGAPIEWLALDTLPIPDLEPLRGMPLTYLWCFSCKKLTTTAPLAGMKLETAKFNACTNLKDLTGLESMNAGEGELSLFNTPIADLSPLKGQKIGTLNLGNCDSIKTIDGLEGATIGFLDLYHMDNLEDISALRRVRVTDKFRLAAKNVKSLTYLSNLRAKYVYIACEQVTSLRGLENLPNLEFLDLQHQNSVTPEEIERIMSGYKDIRGFTPRSHRN